MVSFATSTPNALLSSIKAAIDSGKVATWKYDRNGDFTHSPSQWEYKAYMRPTTSAGSELRFSIICPKGGVVSTEVYAIYHGRFTEMMLAHFDSDFTTAQSTAMPKAGDIVRAA